MRILIADDDSEDLDIFRDAVAEIDPAIECIEVENGEVAMLLLATMQAELPDFIFLDINMPRMTGKECLVEIKKNDLLRNIPVVMYSTSSERKEIDTCLKLGARGYIIKPSHFKELIDAITAIIR